MVMVINIVLFVALKRSGMQKYKVLIICSARTGESAAEGAGDSPGTQRLHIVYQPYTWERRKK